jgi:hypothetical protein
VYRLPKIWDTLEGICKTKSKEGITVIDNNSENGTDSPVQDLHTILEILDTSISAEPEAVQAMFRYGLGLLLVDTGHFSIVDESPDTYTIQGPDDDRLELPRIELPPEQTQLVKDHLSWLLEIDVS